MADPSQTSSGLSSARVQTPSAVVAAPQATVTQLPLLQVRSIRISPKAAVNEVLMQILGALSMPKPARSCMLSGSPSVFCAWVEPRAWLAVSDKQLPAAAADGALVTDISDRVVAFQVSGAGAREVIAAGCDPAIFVNGSFVRVRFAGMAAAFVARFSETDYRLMVDVSISATFAEWLRQTAVDLG